MADPYAITWQDLIDGLYEVAVEGYPTSNAVTVSVLCPEQEVLIKVLLHRDRDLPFYSGANIRAWRAEALRLLSAVLRRSS